MPQSGTSIFTDADTYQASVQDILDLLVLCQRNFHARLTWSDLTHLHLLQARESSARVGYLTPSPDLVFITFPIRQNTVLLYSGTALTFGDIMVHARGENLHQRTTAASEWASIGLTSASLMAFGRTLAGRELVAPLASQIVRPRTSDARRLLRFHAQVCRVVEKYLGHISNREVVRALEDDLVRALTSSMADGTVQEVPATSRRRSDILRSFEVLLAAQPYKLLRAREICASLGISERALRASCALGLGMSPDRYQRLRRLKLVRTALLRLRTRTGGSAEDVVALHGFASLHQFVTEYWRFRGEMPPIPPRSATTD
jgi:AraC-like DNA-binding protein